MAEEKALEFDGDGLVSIEGFSDERVGQEYELYRPQDGRTDRIAVLPNSVVVTKENVKKIKPLVDTHKGFVLVEKTTVAGKEEEVKVFIGHLFKGAYVHFTDQQNFRCLGRGKICCTLAPKDANLQIPVPIFKYTTNSKGEIVGQGASGEFMIWCLNESTFARLRTTEKEFPLVSHDLKVTGKKQGRYVRVENLSACSDCFWRKLSEEEQKEVRRVSTEMYEKRVQRFMGRKLSEEQIRELFGKGPANPTASDASSGVDLDNLVEGIGS
jgi:hypothetical protein